MNPLAMFVEQLEALIKDIPCELSTTDKMRLNEILAHAKRKLFNQTMRAKS